MKKEFTEIVGGTEIRYVIDEATGTYLPDWELPEQRELGRYGRMRAEFLKENHKGLYQAMLLKGTLNKHCAEVEDTAYERLDRTVKAMAKADGLTEEMKNTDPLRWVGMMNNYKKCAEEIIFDEIIYG
ncbi:MAG: TnpV protein [Oscillospiraceae bacterium]|nr:TnpV protein [Oscillospiraceae bacterium]